MSRAFVPEQEDKATDDLPDRAISPEPNYVTPEGLAMIDAELTRVLAEHAATKPNSPDQPRIARDLRYWQARRASAQLVEPVADPEHVRFGATVTIRRDGALQTFKIVGEDEADPANGKLPYVAPLARAMMGKEPGDTVRLGDDTIEVVTLS